MAGLVTGVVGALVALVIGVASSVVQMAALSDSGRFLGTVSAGSMLASQVGWLDAAFLAAAGLAGAMLGLAATALAQALALGPRPEAGSPLTTQPAHRKERARAHPAGRR
jgi:hypothetical protein